MHIRPNDPIPAIRRTLAEAIVVAIGPDGQYTVAPAFGIPHFRMFELTHGNVSHVSAEWLSRRIYRMGGKVSVTVSLGDVQSEWTRAHFRARAIERDMPTARASAAAQASARASRNPPGA